MPCNDGGPPIGYSSYEYDALARQLSEREAMLCAFIEGVKKTVRSTTSLDAILSSIDWTEAGVSRVRFHEWYNEHLQKDALRKLREADAKALADDRASALAKLTPAERRLLGIRD